MCGPKPDWWSKSSLSKISADDKTYDIVVISAPRVNECKCARPTLSTRLSSVKERHLNFSGIRKIGLGDSPLDFFVSWNKKGPLDLQSNALPVSYIPLIRYYCFSVKQFGSESGQTFCGSRVMRAFIIMDGQTDRQSVILRTCGSCNTVLNAVYLSICSHI